MAEEENNQDEQEGQSGADSEEGEETQNKISLVEIILVGSLLGIFWLLGLIPIAGYPFSLLASGGLSMYAKFRINNPVWVWIGSGLNVIPLVNWLPWVGIGYAVAVYDHNNPGKLDKLIGGVSKMVKTAGSVSSFLKGKGGGVKSTEGGGKGDASTTRGDAAKSGTAKARAIEERNRSAMESFNKSNEEMFPGQSQNKSPKAGESINPESMSAMSDLPKMETHGFPDKKDQVDDNNLSGPNISNKKTSEAEKKPENASTNNSKGIEDLDMGDRPTRAGAPRPYSPSLPNKPSWAYDQKAEKAGQQLEQDMEYAKATGGDIKEVFDNYYKNQFVNADSLRNKSGNVAVPLPPNSGKEGKNVVELNGKQVDLRKAA